MTPHSTPHPSRWPQPPCQGHQTPVISVSSAGAQAHPRRTQQWPSVTAGDLGRSLEESETLGRVSVRNLQHIPIVTVGLVNVLHLLLVGEHGKLGGMGSQTQQGWTPSAGTHRANVPRLQGHCPGGFQQPSQTPRRLKGLGKRKGEGKPGVNIAMQDSFYCRGRAGGSWQKSTAMAKGFPCPGTGQSRVSRSRSPGRVSGIRAPGALWGCSGRAGTRQRWFPSWHEASKVWSPAMPKGFSSAECRVGMCRGFSWSSPWSEVALGMGLSRAHSCH